MQALALGLHVMALALRGGLATSGLDNITAYISIVVKTVILLNVFHDILQPFLFIINLGGPLSPGTTKALLLLLLCKSATDNSVYSCILILFLPVI